MCENVVHGTEHDHENRKNGRMCLQSSTMSEHIEITPEIIEIRHYLHAHPERSFKEYETSAYLEKLLRAHDIEVLNNPLETGVVGLIRGDQPGPRIALRADIDGLPIQRGYWPAVLVRQRRCDARLRPRPAHVLHARSRILARKTPQAHQRLH